MLPEEKRSFWGPAVATVFCGLMGLAAIEIGKRLVNLGVYISLTTFWWLFVLLISLGSIAGLVFVWTKQFRMAIINLSILHKKYFPENKVVLGVMLVGLTFFYAYWVIYCGYIVLNGYFVRTFLFLAVSLVGMMIVRSLVPGDSWQLALVGSVSITAAVFQVMKFFPDISASPFSLAWSEGSRYYYGSLLFSESLYGGRLPLSPWHASRYLLLAIPFLFHGLPIWVHRLWQVLLWLGLSGSAGILFARRLKIQDRFRWILFVTWIFLFLHLGPVYYHLLICVILIYAGVDFKKPVQTTLFLFAASVWAGLSRINWIPVPFFLILVLYLLENPWLRSIRWWQYLLKPLMWLSSLGVALLAYMGYIPLSGNEANKFGSSFTSALLWNRLWPNATFPVGILPGTLLVSLPLVVVIFVRLKIKYRILHPLKWIAFLLMGLALFFGGLVVSVKIGGGSNLHNMDAYFVLLMTIAGYFFWGKEVSDFDPPTVLPKVTFNGYMVGLAIIIPVLLTLRVGVPVALPDPTRDTADLQKLQQVIDDHLSPGDEVLFISERQLLVFNQIVGVKLVPGYEKMELMEMAMSNNTAYLEQFYQDISRHRFAMIINDPIQRDMKDEIDPFGEENNVWVKKVIMPLLRSYQYSTLGERKEVVIMTPK